MSAGSGGVPAPGFGPGDPTSAAAAASASGPACVATVMTFNIGRGATGPRGASQDELGLVADAVLAVGAEVAALQEVHAEDIPILLDALAAGDGPPHHAHFTPTVPVATMAVMLRRARRGGDGARMAHLRDRMSDYGVATLTRAPLTLAEEHVLPDDGRERRVAQEVCTLVGGGMITVLNAHLSTDGQRDLKALVTGRPSPRGAQTRALLRIAAAVEGPVVVLGDLNQVPGELARHLRRSRLRMVNHPARPTHGRRVIDYILTGPDVVAVDPEVRADEVSDHQPVVARLAVGGPARGVRPA